MLKTTLLALLATILILTSATSTTHIHKIPLRLSSDYVYYATLSFGSQQQPMEVLLDTGSRTLAVFCDLCQRGCPKHLQFKTSESDSYHNMTCQAVKKYAKELPYQTRALSHCLVQCQGKDDKYECGGQINYGSGSVGSFFDYKLALDQIAIDDDEAIASSFGCIYREQQFEQGIWGVSFKPDNEVLEAIYTKDIQEGRQASKVFTICTNGSEAVMNVGGIDDQYHIDEGVTVGIYDGYPLWWRLVDDDVGRFILGDTVLREKETSLGKKGIILDSGTDFNLLPCSVEQKLTEVIDQYCKMYQVMCHKLKPSQAFNSVYAIEDPAMFFSWLPPLEIELKDKILQTPLSNYFWKMDDNIWALAVMCTEKYGFSNSILGSTWMNNFDIVFDRQNKLITIHDISRCAQDPTRLLQSQEKPIDIQTETDPYELPAKRESINSYASLYRAKMKADHSLYLMNNQ